jgi:hypothetical protein
LSVLSAAVGIAGVQIILWSIGVRLDILGTREIGVEPPISKLDAARGQTPTPLDWIGQEQEVIGNSLKILDAFESDLQQKGFLSTSDLLQLAHILRGDPEIRALTLRAIALNEQLRLRNHYAELSSRKRKAEFCDVLAELKVGLLLRMA